MQKKKRKEKTKWDTNAHNIKAMTQWGIYAKKCFLNPRECTMMIKNA